MVLFSHRGGSIENPENTLQAFQASSQLKDVVIETDTQCTKDGEVVMFHDTNLERMTSVSCNISQTNFEDLPKKYVPSYMCEFGHHNYSVGKQDKAELCTLE